MVVDEAARHNPAGELGSVGVVVGATIGRTGVDFSGLNGSILAPGLGAQGGTAADLAEVFGPAASLVLPTTSREVMAAGPDPAALRAVAARIRGEMEAVLARGVSSQASDRQRRTRPVTIPPLSDEQRQQARSAATQARRRRAEVKQALRSGERTLAEVLSLAEQDDVIAHTKVIDVLRALPRVGHGAGGQGDGATGDRRQPAAARAGQAPDRRADRGVLRAGVRLAVSRT